MGLKPDRVLFGIHSITPRSLTDFKPYGILKVLGGGNMEMSGDTEDLYGGSSKFPFASEATKINCQLTANVKSYPNFLMELFLGAEVTTRDASATGEIANLANKKGSSINATTGISAVAIKSGGNDDLKFGSYLIVAVDATKVDVYAITDIDFNRGAKGSYIDDSLKIASELTITQSADTEITGFGLKLTGGSGTIGFTAGDTASFDVLPPHNGVSEILVGSATADFPAFNAIMLAAKRGSREIFQVEAFNVIASGCPIPLQEKAFAVSDLTMKCLRDDAMDAVYKITTIAEV